MAAAIREEDGLKWGKGQHSRESKHGCLCGCISIAFCTSVSCVADIRGHAWPVNYGMGMLFEGVQGSETLSWPGRSVIPQGSSLGQL